MFKLITGKEPDYLFNNLQLSTRSNVIILPRHSTSQYNKSFFVSAANAYNMLPNATKLCSTLASFKKRCSEHFFVQRM